MKWKVLKLDEDWKVVGQWIFNGVTQNQMIERLHAKGITGFFEFYPIEENLTEKPEKGD